MLRNDKTIPRLIGAGQTGNPELLCAMEYISWENGDAAITDYPECSNVLAARLVQAVNDRLASERGTGFVYRGETLYRLRPRDVSTVLALGDLTKGTHDTPPATDAEWLAGLIEAGNDWVWSTTTELAIWKRLSEFRGDPLRHAFQAKLAIVQLLEFVPIEELVDFATEQLLKLRGMANLSVPEPTFVGATS